MKLPVLPEATDPPWFAAGLSFTCTQCGNCCTGGPGYVWITRNEVEKIAEHLGLSVEQVRKQYCRKIGVRWSLKEVRQPGGLFDCIFLTQLPPEPGEGVRHARRGCSIYPVRPLQCRTWPFWDGNLASPDAWNTAAKGCPGINRGGRSFTQEQIESLRDAREWPASPPTSEEVPHEAPAKRGGKRRE